MAKRTNGEGTTYQSKDGLWRAEITLGYDDKAKRVKKTKSSKDLDVVQKWLNDERFRLARNIITTNNDYTVSEWLTFWLENYKIHSIKSKTYDGYEHNFSWYINPKIGDMKLTKVKGETIQQIYNHLHKKGLSTSTIKNTQVPLSQAFEQAITNELIYTNIAQLIISPIPFTILNPRHYSAQTGTISVSRSIAENSCFVHITAPVPRLSGALSSTLNALAISVGGEAVFLISIG